MQTTNINIRTDSETKVRAQKIFNTLGLDMTTAINLFLRQTIRMNDIPFILTTKTNNPEKLPEKLFNNENTLSGLGCMKGKMWMADDFNMPLEDFSEYMK